MMTKKPRFFCDNCGAEVPIKAKNCPECGRFFSSVRCPVCGFSAEEARFMSGCPRCGYSAPGQGQKQVKKQPNSVIKTPFIPFWIYLLAAAVIAAILSVVFFSIRLI
ncbi:MAG: zinc ribbon domain-containing protein [Treponema sp.]|nr:zinc ribbon domain-containing protein [Treponema sp.]